MSNLKSNYQAFVASLFNRTGDLSKDFSHAAMGIVTEIHELLKAPDAVNALEERGDLEFFGVALNIVVRDHLGERFSVVDAMARQREVRDQAFALSTEQEILTAFSIALLDQAKRWVGYGKVPEDLYGALAMADILQTIAEAVSAKKYGAQAPAEVVAANMRKLLKRYPEGQFDAFRATVRDLEAERAALASA